MTSSRTSIALTGAALALVTAVLIDQGSFLGAELPRAVLLGASLGAVAGLVPDGSVTARLSGFVIGFTAAWIGYALRAGFLPDIPRGRAVAAVVVIGIVTVVAASTSGRIPLWSGLLGIGAMHGGYETTFATSPTTFVTESMTAATTVLLAAVVGVLLSRSVLWRQPAAAPPREAVELPSPRRSADADVQAGVTL